MGTDEVLSTGQVISTLRADGFEITPAYLGFLLQSRHVLEPERILGRFLWRPADIDRLRSVLVRRNRGPQRTAHA